MDDERSGNLVARWRAGDQQAAAELFRRYADRLIALARGRLSRRLAARIDPEDVVQSVYHIFFTGAREGRYELGRGGDLWQLLVTLTLHRLCRQARRHGSAKRDVGRERTLGGNGAADLQPHLLAHDPSPPEAAALTDELEQLLARLKPLHRRMVELRLQGHNLDEIAACTQRSERTVMRVLEEVKDILRQRQLEGLGS